MWYLVTLTAHLAEETAAGLSYGFTPFNTLQFTLGDIPTFLPYDTEDTFLGYFFTKPLE